MPFSVEETRRWHEEKRRREQEPIPWHAEPVAICVHCQNPFGINQGSMTSDVAICDVCNGE
jgi:hypothetical protein